MNNQQNLIIAVVFSVIILFGFQYFFPSPTQSPVQTQASPQQQTGMPAQQLATATPLLTREEALTIQPQRIQIQSGTLKGSINLQGAILDDLVLTKYRETVNPNSPEIVLLSPENTPNAYFARFGWASSQGSLPNEKTLWQAHGTTLTPQSPVTLSWDNGHGLSFSQVLSLDENYMFTITQRVKNTSETPLSLSPQGYLAKRGEPKSSGFFIL
ncbi:MAG: membrane protein insertase YidC, partial [Alphaproteobacteria bacterium]|nr:membrane protein insertase YidC [Alphaproteobacteria bacterium]